MAQNLLNPPIVSVLMTVYNGLPTLKGVLESLVNQTLDDIEIIVVDDASTDGSTEFLKDFSKSNDKVKCHFPGKLGRGKALNFGLSKCQGEFIAINDADDVSMPERLEKNYEFLKTHPDYGMVGSNFLINNKDANSQVTIVKPETNEEIRKFLTIDQPLQHSTCMMRKSVLDQIGGYSTSIDLLFDREIFIRIAKVSKIHNIQEPLVQIERHSNQFFYHSFSQYKRRYMHNTLRMRAIIDLGFPKYWLISPIFWLIEEYISISLQLIFNKKRK